MNTVAKLLQGALRRLGRLVFRSRRGARFVEMLGGPGAGKGTVAGKVSPELHLPHFNMGNVFRREIDNKTFVGRKYGPTIKAGKLVPDFVVMLLLFRELWQSQYKVGAVLDGIPRTRRQAIWLDWILAFFGNEVELSVLLDVPIDDMIDRLSLRRTCTNKQCGKTYHLRLNPPVKEGVCDACGSPLFQRDDDKPEAIVERMREFERTFAALRAHYKAEGKLAVVVSTNQLSIAQVTTAVLFAIEEAR